VYTIEESEADIGDPDETPLQRFLQRCKTNQEGVYKIEVKGQELGKNNHESWVIKEETL
jgi:hypothetical protein